MKKEKFLLLGLTSTVVLSAAILAGNFLGSKGLNVVADATTYSLVLNKDNKLTNEENANKEFVRNTAGGNPITFKTFGGGSFVSTDNNFAQARDKNGWFYNDTAITGLYKIVIKSTNARKYKISYGETKAYEYETDEITGSGEGVTINLARNENIKFFKWEATEAANNWLGSIELFYTCGTGLAERGTQFAAGESYTISTDKAYSMTADSVNVDVKFTSDSSKKINVMLFGSESWDHYAGYYGLYPSTKTGDFAGITVTSLTDGYTRFTFNLAQLRKFDGDNAKTTATFTTVTRLYIRGGWSDATGYIDVTPTVPVVANRGAAFTAGKDYSADTNLPVATGTLVFDIRFTTDPATTKISLMLGDGWSNYFGYFDFTTTSTTGCYDGFTVSKTADGYTRCTINLNQLTKVGGGSSIENINNITLFYIRGVWTTASGYVDVMPSI